MEKSCKIVVKIGDIIFEKGLDMAIQWIKTAHKGLRYYEHQTRKHGKQKDRYYSIYFKVDKKLYNYGIGWLSEGIPEEISNADPGLGFQDYCLKLLRQYKGNVKSGKGVTSPKEQRKVEKEKRQAEEEAKKAEALKAEAEALTISRYFEETYFPDVKPGKAANTIRQEKGLFSNWIDPLIGNVPMQRLSETDMARLKQAMIAKKKSDKTVHLTLALVRHVYSHAKLSDVYQRAKVKLPKVDNAKLRYLSPEEIGKLFEELGKISETVRDQAFLAVQTGIRFSEVAGLTWQDVNFKTGSLAVRDAKTGSRTAFFNKPVEEMLRKRQGRKRTGLVFPNAAGKRQTAVSRTFQRVADRLFNKGVKDKRLRVSFHSLRHSFGSHVYQNTGDLYLTAKALGHKSLTMAQRYAKQSEAKLKTASAPLGDLLEKAKSGQEVDKVINIGSK